MGGDDFVKSGATGYSAPMNSRELIESTLRDFLKALGIVHGGIAHSEVAGQSIFSIQVEDGRSLIGVRGDTIHAIDTLIKKIVEKKLQIPAQEDGSEIEGGNPLHFLVDVNEYRTKQIKDLQNKALMMAERARSFQYDVELTPMSSYERLIIHSTLSGAPNIKTESQGEGRNRRVVIRYTA